MTLHEIYHVMSKLLISAPVPKPLSDLIYHGWYTSIVAQSPQTYLVQLVLQHMMQRNIRSFYQVLKDLLTQYWVHPLAYYHSSWFVDAEHLREGRVHNQGHTLR